MLRSLGLARFWIREAFGHNKAIGVVGKGIQLVEDAIREAKGVTLAAATTDSVTESYGVITLGKAQAGSGEKIDTATKSSIDTFFEQIGMHRCW